MCTTPRTGTQRPWSTWDNQVRPTRNRILSRILLPRQPEKLEPSCPTISTCASRAPSRAQHQPAQQSTCGRALAQICYLRISRTRRIFSLSAGIPFLPLRQLKGRTSHQQDTPTNSPLRGRHLGTRGRIASESAASAATGKKATTRGADLWCLTSLMKHPKTGSSSLCKSVRIQSRSDWRERCSGRLPSVARFQRQMI